MIAPNEGGAAFRNRSRRSPRLIPQRGAGPGSAIREERGMARRARSGTIFSILFSLSLLVLSGLGIAAATSAPVAAQEEKTLVYVTPSLALTMDPCFLPGAQTAEIIQNLYWPWTNYSQIEGEDGMMVDDTASAEANMQPGVLESWETSEDGTVWTLHIRQGVMDSFGNE